MGDNEHVHVADNSRHAIVTIVLVQLGQAELVNYSYSELSYVSVKLIFCYSCIYRSTCSIDWQCIVQGAISQGRWQLRLCIACSNATDIELHVHTYAVGVADIAAHEGSPHNVLHSSSYRSGLNWKPDTCIMIVFLQAERGAALSRTKTKRILDRTGN